MAKSYLPKPRPSNLPEAVVGPDADPPIKVPSDPGDGPTFQWLEECRDHHEKNGELLTVKGMLAYARGIDPNDKELQKQIQKFYGSKAESPAPKPNKKAAPTPKADKKPAAKETKTVATKTAAPPAKKAGKPTAAPAKNGNGKGNPQKKAKAPAARPAPAPSGKVLLEANVRGLNVLVRSVNDSVRGTINDYPMRGVLRFFGAKGKTTGEARDALTKLMAKWKGGEEYAAAMSEEGHCGSGAKEADGQKGSFGPAPESLVKDKETSRALLALFK